MLVLDGSLGEGGGQILRTALAASIVTSTPFRIERIRAGRRRPGLRPQHLAAVEAAAAVGSAETSGAAVGSEELEFHPGGIRSGVHRFDIGTAGSTTLVAQTVLPVLASVMHPSEVRVTGGTHNDRAPTFEFLDRTYLPAVSSLGWDAVATLHRHGFHPVGGGRMSVSVRPASQHPALDLVDRGEVQACSAIALLSRLPDHIAERELAVVGDDLGWTNLDARRVDADGPGNAVLLEIESEHITTVVSSIGRRGLSAEKVAARAVAEARAYLDSEVPVGPHLADQLLVPLAVAGAGRFLTSSPTSHFQTNLEVVERFLSVGLAVEEGAPGAFLVSCG